MSSPPTVSEPTTVPRYAPLEHFFGPTATFGAMPRSGRLTPHRLAARLRNDAALRMAVALAIPVAILATISGDPPVLAVAVPVVFVAIQVGMALVQRAPAWWPMLRLGASLIFVLLANVAIDQSGTWPLNALNIPIVALAAAIGGGAATALVLLAIATSLLPLAAHPLSSDVSRDAIAVAMAGAVLAVGSRRVVRSLERSAHRLRRANARDRRRARQFGALETVGRVLAVEGPTREALDRVMGLLEDTFGYHYPSVYLLDGPVLRLAAYHNYDTPIETVPADKGVIGRTVRTNTPILLRDARTDPDFWSADTAIVDEISIPLSAGGEVFGVLNVESDMARRLDEDDFGTMLIIGDRIAAAMALGRERQKLTERSQLLDRLTAFATGLNALLESEAIYPHVATGAGQVVAADMVILVLLDPSNGEFRTVASAGGDPRVIGTRILPGEGVTGGAIETRTIVVADSLERARFPKSTARIRIADVVAAMSTPLIYQDEVLGALTWLREQPQQVFSLQEQEIAVLMGSRVAVALANATLHAEAREAAITDPLTGIHNRRHFDAAMAHADALRERLDVADRRERSTILFDLDHFGAINKRHGHQVGDQILRSFAEVLRSRVRASDLVARFGGEEFVVILDGANRDEAVRLADEIRIAFRQRSIDNAESGLPITTVSAGCASLERIETSGTVLLERADVGLAMAKAGGRDQVVAA
ncbi:MAG TPA: diguanylate cyclase [Candidatus Limnocylindrales bacterium]